MKELLGRKLICESYKTPYRKPIEAKQWIDFDCSGQSCGRLASEVAKILRGKHDPKYTPHGSFFRVNCYNYDKMVLTGNKLENKIYYDKVSDHFGSLKETRCENLLKRGANHVIFRAVKGMLPRGNLKKNLHKYIKFSDNPGGQNE